ncbi:MAG: imidazole glycerol phosphate synthase subunit HisF [Flavobacteriales bacterium]
MLAKRIIPCLDVKNGRTVKGINFEDLRDMGDPVELALYYSQEGADELVFLDITATYENRGIMINYVQQVARQLSIPFTVGGGISSVEDVAALLDAGADKISVNSAAFRRPELICELATQFGSQCIVVAIDTKCEENDWWVYLNGGRIKTEALAVDWARKSAELGAGEILLTSMNNDGTKSGFANDITAQISKALKVPVIASGGAGTMEHFYDAFIHGKADAALAAGIFHNKEMKISALKKYLSELNIPVRL